MKRYFLIFATLTVFATALFFNNIKAVISPETPVSKEINLAVATDNNYTSAVYKDALAKVQIAIIKVSGNKQTIVWDKTYDNLPLQKYPELTNAFIQNIKVPNILDSKEKLYISYKVTYNSKGSVLQVANGSAVSTGDSEEKLFINI
ncbi:MAG TPA: hypothetical protein PLA68_03840 [Panacibacter sp.]|nr:hypothetical protein [Panacibacter sp.]